MEEMEDEWREILRKVVLQNLEDIERCGNLRREEKERYARAVKGFLNAVVREVILIPSGKRGVVKVMLEVRDEDC